ncbi:MAG: hydrogenase subunit MbhD domain-containing protein [Candidatus Omnitrophota bacterium]
MIEIYLILIFMIVAAIIAVAAKDLLSSVVAIGAVGIGLSMAFLLLRAPDLAIMQLVVEILSLIILIRATARKDVPFSVSGRWVFNTLATALFGVVFLVCAYVSIKCMPEFGSPLMRVSKVYIAEGLARTGAMNIVAAINLNYRALDTLCEATMLFAAIIGVLAVARKIGRKG